MSTIIINCIIIIEFRTSFSIFFLIVDFLVACSSVFESVGFDSDDSVSGFDSDGFDSFGSDLNLRSLKEVNLTKLLSILL